MKQNADPSSKLGTMQIGKLMLIMSFPAVLSMLVQSLYNIVDSIFVARISEDALNAVTIAYPMQMLVLAFALGIGVGTNSLVARKLGEGKLDDASNVAQTGLFMSLIMSAFFLITGYFIAKGFISLYAENPDIQQMGTQYLAIVMMVSVGQFIDILIGRVFQATGNMIVPMTSQLIGAVTNIVLDPLLIFGLIGFPAIGVAGAAVATVVGQLASMTFCIIAVLVKKPAVKVFFHHFRMRGAVFAQIIRVGIPTMVMNAVGSFTTMLMNAILIRFSKIAVNVLGIYFKLQSFVFMPVFGMNQGCLPIMGYNFGAGNKKRFVKTYSLCVMAAAVMMVIGLLIFQLAPAQLLSLFNADAETLAIGVPALRRVSLCFVPAAFGIVTTTMFQAVGHGVKSLLMSLVRQIIFILPFAYAFSKINLDSIWFAYPVAELLCVLIFMPIAFKTLKSLFKNTTPPPSPGIELEILPEQTVKALAQNESEF